MTAPIADASVYADFAGLAALKRDARAADPQALREVARQFESIFAKMMLSSMRKASFGDPLLGSQQQEFYQGMFDDQLSVELTKGKGLGLAEMLVQQLTRAGLAPQGATDAKPADKTPPALKLGGAPTTATARPEANPDANPFAVTTGLLAPNLDGSALESSTAFIAKLLAGHAAAAAPSSGSATANAASGVQSFWRPESPEDFVRQLMPAAEEAGKELGVDPRHLLAQAALETGWGKALPVDAKGNTSNNLFGIKAGSSWAGKSVSVRTLEFEGGLPVPRQAQFRAYDSAADSFRDYVSVLRDNPRYADALNTGSDTKAFATALQRGGYATDPAYARKITAIAQNLPTSSAALKSSEAAPIPDSLDTL